MAQKKIWISQTEILKLRQLYDWACVQHPTPFGKGFMVDVGNFVARLPYVDDESDSYINEQVAIAEDMCF